jgi:Fe(II)/alpha-ketoglutarate-dependent arginine beta-hydroxylase
MAFVHLSVEPNEATEMLATAERLLSEVEELDHISSIPRAAALSADFPFRIRATAARLRSGDDRIAALLVTGNDLGPITSVPTPRSFGERRLAEVTRLADGLLYLLGTSIGTPYCFASQQRGSLVLDVLPLPGHEEDQLGCSSTAALEWHTEDAFHALRADYTLLMCIRNEQRVATRFVFASDLELTQEELSQLREPQFVIIPDISHNYRYNVATSGVVDDKKAAFARLEEAYAESRRVAVLQGDRSDQQICVDFAYMPSELHSDVANAALQALRAAIERASHSIVLGAGDILVLDNRRCVHGRDSFGARYDGKGRWLRRLNISSDLLRITANQIAPGSLCVG